MYKANHYLVLHPLLYGQKYLMSLFYMEASGFFWSQDVEKIGILSTWDSFIEVLQIRFGHASYDDLMDAIKRLRQTSPVAEYKTQFEMI